MFCDDPPNGLLASLLPNNEEADGLPPATGTEKGLLALGLEEGAAVPNSESGTAEGPELGVSNGDAPATRVAFP